MTTADGADPAAPVGTGPVTVRVAGAAPYEVSIGRGLTDRIVAAAAGSRTAVILHQPTVTPAVRRVVAAVERAGRRVHTVALPDAEAAKTVTVLERCWAEFAAAGVGRTDVVIGVGGGAVTDLAGFAAATWMRGVPVIQVPTSLLGMVDAAVGGKTGINTAAGKNMVGAFHEPRAVVADLELLEGLPRAEIISGMAEVIKCGFIADPTILELVEADGAAALDPAGPILAELVRRAVTVKAGVVAVDLRESDRREILNYGHTLAHAIERAEGYRWRHGYAVAVGMVFVAELARAAGRLDDATVERHRRVLEGVGLPTAYPDGELRHLIAGMTSDKKVRDGRLRFVILDGLARPGRLVDPAPQLLEAAWHAMTDTGHRRGGNTPEWNPG